MAFTNWIKDRFFNYKSDGEKGSFPGRITARGADGTGRTADIG